MAATRRNLEPRPGIQCPNWCGPVHVKGVRKEDITCPCGYGYYSKKTGEFISGDLVRAGKAVPKDADKITVPEKCWNDPAHAGHGGQLDELPGHDPFFNGPPKTQNYSLTEMTSSQSPYYSASALPYSDVERPQATDDDKPPARLDTRYREPSGRISKDERTLYFVPSDGIDFEVITDDIQIHLGPDASVERGNHPKNGTPGYHIRATRPVSIAIISDLKADSIRWQRECQVLSSAEDYLSSQTHKSRLKNSSTRDPPLQTSENYRLSREGLNQHESRSHSTPRSSLATPTLSRGSTLQGHSYSLQREAFPSTSRSDRHVLLSEREDMETLIAQRLRNQEHSTISRTQLDSLVEQEMERLKKTTISADSVLSKR